MSSKAMKMALKQQEEYYNGRAVLGIPAMFYFLLGARERGKSYFVLETFLKQYFKSKYERVFYWLRLTDTEAKSLLNNNALKLIDPALRRKYIERKGYITRTNADCVYIVKLDDKGKEIKNTKHLLCHVLSVGSAGNTKGNGFFDQEYIKRPNAWYNICLDEFNRDETQRKTFDIVHALGTQLENLIRSTKERVRIVCIANNTTACSELLSRFNFIPFEFGIFKLKSKKCVIENIPNNEAYKNRRKGTALDILLGENDSNISNTIELDRSQIKPKKQRLFKPKYIIKFAKSKDKWFTVWDNNIVCDYKGETCNRIIAMRMYLDENYNELYKKMIIDMFNTRSLQYSSIKTSIKFQAELESVKRS